MDIFLTNLAASDILQAGVVLPIHFKNLSVYDENFYGGEYESFRNSIYLSSDTESINF